MNESTPTIHDLKVWPEFYEPLVRGDKTFEVRLNDRGFAVGHILLLREWSAQSGYSGRRIVRDVTYLLEGPQPSLGLADRFVVMGLSR